MGIKEKLFGKIPYEKLWDTLGIDKLPGMDQLMANVQAQFMSLECESEVTGEKIEVIIAKADKIKFENFLSKIEEKYNKDVK